MTGGRGSQGAPRGTVPTKFESSPGSLKFSASPHLVNIILVPRVGDKFESPDSTLNPPMGGQDSNSRPRTQI